MTINWKDFWEWRNKCCRDGAQLIVSIAIKQLDDGRSFIHCLYSDDNDYKIHDWIKK